MAGQRGGGLRWFSGRIGLPAINEGLLPGMAPLRLPQLIGLGPASRPILSGEIIEPDEALRLWLIDA